MREDDKEAFDRWFKWEEEAGLGLTDEFEVGVIRAVAKAAYEAGMRRRALRKAR